MPEPVGQIPDHYQTRIDYADTTTQYIGRAAPTALITQAAWQVQRLTFDSSGRVTHIEWAGLAANFDQKFSNRTSLTYRPT